MILGTRDLKALCSIRKDGRFVQPQGMLAIEWVMRIDRLIVQNGLGSHDGHGGRWINDLGRAVLSQQTLSAAPAVDANGVELAVGDRVVVANLRLPGSGLTIDAVVGQSLIVDRVDSDGQIAAAEWKGAISPKHTVKAR